MSQYRVVFEQVPATVTVSVEVPEEVLTGFTHPVHGLDEQAVEDWVADHAHSLATEAVTTWGFIGDTLLDLSLDGIGADVVEAVQ